MATVKSTQEKSYRMDVRLSQLQRQSYERAASLKGQTLTQWATSHLDASAEEDIRHATTTVLNAQAFDAFCALLDEPVPAAAQELLESKAVWE